MIQILQGHVIDKLRELPERSVHCCVTSPPYWGLRDYKLPPVTWADGWSGQLGLESAPDLYVAHIVSVFAEVWRVLRDDGTCWVNLGDTFCHDSKGGSSGNKNELKQGYARKQSHNRDSGCKAKDLVGVPWMVAFALRAAGWYLRSEIIWAKPNVMPESVTDRPTRAHEQIFLLSKRAKYSYDAEAIAEPCESGPSDVRKMVEGKDRIDAKHFHTQPDLLAKANPQTRIGRKRGVGGLKFAMGSRGTNSRMYKDRDVQHLSRSGNKERDFDGRLNHKAGGIPWEGLRRNKRDVWWIASAPYKGAHFATFPPDLIRPCILAGCPSGGTVLDPFFGSGTTGQVCLDHGRNCIGIDLNLDYCALAKDRVPLFTTGVTSPYEKAH